MVELFKTDKRILIAFIACFLVAQLINLWAIFPNYEGWHILGFPLIFLRYMEADPIIYFDIILLTINLLIWYFVGRGIVHGYDMLNKYKIIEKIH